MPHFCLRLSRRSGSQSASLGPLHWPASSPKSHTIFGMDLEDAFLLGVCSAVAASGLRMAIGEEKWPCMFCLERLEASYRIDSCGTRQWLCWKGT